MIEIDGSYREGGGQIARTSVALSAVTGKPCRIFNIRKGRPKPGLKAQHLNGINALADLCNAKVKGDILGSEEIEFNPEKIKSGKMKIDIGTAGSITLILQTLIPAAIHAEKEVELEIIGGTDVKWSPNIEYFQEVFCRNLKRMGIEIESKLLKYGFYPKGGGKVKVKIKPWISRKPLNLLERGNVNRYDIRSIVSKQLEKAKVAERQIEGAKKIIPKFDCEYFEYVDTLSVGSSVHIHAHCDNSELGATVLGERGKPAEKVGEECALLLKKQIDSEACLDRWMADQILPYMALAVCDMGEQGIDNITSLQKNISALKKEKINQKSSAQKLEQKSKISVAEITNHCLTNAWTIEKFLPVKFKINKERRTIEV